MKSGQDGSKKFNNVGSKNDFLDSMYSKGLDKYRYVNIKHMIEFYFYSDENCNEFFYYLTGKYKTL